jgi:signal transduction histidine kinase
LDNLHFRKKQISTHQITKNLLISLVLVLFALSLKDTFPYFYRLDLQFGDISRHFAYMSGLKPCVGKDAVFVVIDSKTQEELGLRFPFPRSIFAELLEKISKSHPRLFAIDMAFIGTSEHREDDTKLANALKKINTVLFTFITENMRVSPLVNTVKEVVSSVGIINLINDPDGVIRSTFPFYADPVSGKRYYCAESLLALKYFCLPESTVEEDCDNRALVFPARDSPLKTAYYDSKFRLEYKYYFQSKDIFFISFCDVYRGKYDMNLFKDKVVFLGNTSPVQHDVHLTPFGSQDGISIVYNIFLSFINNAFPKPLPFYSDIILMVLLVLLGLSILSCFSHGKNLFLTFPLLVFIWVVDYSFYRLNLKWDGFLPFISIAFAGFFREGMFYYQTWMDNLRMENKLKETEQEIQLSQKLANVGKVAAQIVHELKNPLGNLINMKHWFRQYIDSGHPANECIEALDKEASRMLKLCQQILQFSKPVQEGIKLFDFHDLLRDTFQFLKGSLDKKKIQVKISFSPGKASFKGNEDQLKQVFLNLIMNAMDAMENGGELSIETRIENNIIEIRISDTGIGIPKENLEKIFDLFFTTKGETGTGLGLSISYDIIKKHAGRILVESEEGKGSAFTLIFAVE